MRVLLLADESLLSVGVEKLLDQGAFEILSCDPHQERVVDCINAIQPDVVILTAGRRPLEPSPDWLSVLRNRPGLRLIVLNLEETAVCVYYATNYAIQNPGDLIAVIRSSSGWAHLGCKQASSRISLLP